VFSGSVASLAAAVRAAYETLKALREGTKPKDVAGVASPELMKRRRAMPIIVARRGNSSAAEKFPA
jgi:hypothetical protein